MTIKQISSNLIKTIIDSFWQNNKHDLYNEFSLQFELGIYLRSKLDNRYLVEFERNVSYFKNGVKTCKKEIDIVIYTKDKKEKYAIELKFPTNGQYPEQMYKFVEDIKFMEELKGESFNGCYVLTLVDDNHKGKSFHKGQNKDIYGYFRGKKPSPITGKIYKPTGVNKNIDYHDIKGSYKIEWKRISQDSNCWYYFLEI